MSQPMEWDELARQAEALRADRSATAVGLAAQGAQLLHRALTQMYIGEPELLRAVATAIARARPEVVALRNVGVSAYRTAREARSGDRMAAGARGVARLARILTETPNALARRGQPLLLEGSTVVTLGRSRSVLAALALAGDRVQDVYVIRDAIPAGPALDGATYRTHETPVEDTAAALDASNIVLLGCSAFLADGSMASDEGALALVEAAFSHDPPVPVSLLRRYAQARAMAAPAARRHPVNGHRPAGARRPRHHRGRNPAPQPTPPGRRRSRQLVAPTRKRRRRLTPVEASPLRAEA